MAIAKRVVEVASSEAIRIEYSQEYLPWDSINVLAQPRKTFRRIEELALSLAKSGSYAPSLICEFGEEAYTEYLAAISGIWEIELDITKMIYHRVKGERSYYQLVAGERRHRAYGILLTLGCTECQEKYGIGPCYHRHYPDVHERHVEVRLARNITAEEAIDATMKENTYEPLDDSEEVTSYARRYRYLTRGNPSLSITAFARMVGRSPETVSGDLKICGLPEFIFKAFHEGLIKKGIALQLVRLQDYYKQLHLADGSAAYNEGEKSYLNQWLAKALISGGKVEPFRQMVDEYLQTEKHGQQDLLEIMLGSAAEEFKKNQQKAAIDHRLTMGASDAMAYLAHIIELFKSGTLDPESSPLARRQGSKSPKTLLKIFETAKHELLPYLEEITKSETIQQMILDTTKRSSQLLSELEGNPQDVSRSRLVG